VGGQAAGAQVQRPCSTSAAGRRLTQDAAALARTQETDGGADEHSHISAPVKAQGAGGLCELGQVGNLVGHLHSRHSSQARAVLKRQVHQLKAW
jgi:hypothetical protein